MDVVRLVQVTNYKKLPPVHSQFQSHGILQIPRISWKPCFANADSRKIFMFQTVQSTPMKGFPATGNTNRVALEHYYKIQLNLNIAAITPNLLTGES